MHGEGTFTYIIAQISKPTANRLGSDWLLGHFTLTSTQVCTVGHLDVVLLHLHLF